jgi:hypothetical protein
MNLENIVNKINSKGKLTIGVDIDNVLFHIPIVEHINSGDLNADIASRLIFSGRLLKDQSLISA